MSFAVLGLVAEDEISIDGAANIDTSYPGFVKDLRAVGGNVVVAGEG